MEELFKILKLTEDELKIKLYNHLLNCEMNAIFEDGFVYAEGNIPILLVAHIDTVLDNPPKNLYYDEVSDIIFSPDGGIGADDRCGVYAILKLLEKFKPHVLFTEDEEMGGIGAKKAVQKLPKPHVKYIIEFDRRGSRDCVFYKCGNIEFIDYIEMFGFEMTTGTFSDISVLGPIWDLAAVNLSTGYYYEHTDFEYIRFQELENNISIVEKMLSLISEAKYFSFQKVENEITHINYIDLIDYIWIEKYYAGIDEFSNLDNKTLSLKRGKKTRNKGGDDNEYN